MWISKKLFALAVGTCSLFAACGQDSNPSNFSSGSDTPNTPKFEAFSCQEVSDPSVSAELEKAKANIADILKDIGKGNFKSAQVISAQTKSSFKSVLDKYPGNCEAQLGYALSIITDLVNNKDIKSFIDTVQNKIDLDDMGVRDFNQLLITSDGKLLTSFAQEAMAQAIPSMDSAIIYMKNIVGDDKFTCNYTYKDKTYELDRGEFAPALAAMFVTKAILTFGASINIDFSTDNKYDWVNDNRFTAHEITESGARTIISLMSKESAFSRVYSNWTSRYTDIPNLLDTAIAFAEVGLQYGIDEAKTGRTTQKNDPYIVGDDEMSDVSVRDFKKAIDSLEHYRESLHTGVTITLPHGTKLVVNLAKFFQITDGYQQYLPYHKFNDASIWNIPVEGFEWSTDFGYHGVTYAENDLIDAVRYQVEKAIKFDYFHAHANQDYRNPEKHYFCLNYEIGDERFDKCYDLLFNNCEVSFSPISSNYYNDDIVTFVPSPVKLNSSVCKVENGIHLFANAYLDDVPNAFYFTDASGNKTISYQKLANGKPTADGKEYKDYTFDDMQNYIFFPDVTFGGVFPGMTADAFWKLLKTEFRDNED